MTYRIRNIAIAFALAIAGAILTTIYVTNYKRHVQQGEESVPVFVAAQDIPKGTTGAQIAARHLMTERDVARRNVVPGAISEPSQVEKLVAVQPVYAGEQVTLRRFGTKAQQGLRAELTGNQRAIQVPGDANQLLVGTLKAGDHVDLVANLRLDTNSGVSAATRIVLRDLLVLTAPSSGGKVSTAPDGADSAILAISDTQVQRLFFVIKNADWTLQLRPVVNATDSGDRVDTLNTVLGEGR